MSDNLYEVLQARALKLEPAVLVSCNEKTEKFGLALTEDEAARLVVCRNQTLKKYQRVELGKGILDKLIFTFCDSQYINQSTYLETLEQLQNIFYEFKNECEDEITDEELLHFMREQFDHICFGSTEYLESTCLPRFAAAIRAGYRDFHNSDGYRQYTRFGEEQRWDKQLYFDALNTLNGDN